MWRADWSPSFDSASLYVLQELLLILVTDPRTSTLLSLLLIAAVIDYRTYRIPNWLTFGGAAFALLYSIAVPFTPFHGFLWSLGGLTVGLFIMLPLHMLRVMGAGDVKLMAMAGAFLGVADTLYAVLSTFIVGGVAGILFALYYKVFGRMISNIKASVQLMLLSAVTGTAVGNSVQAAQSVGKLPYGVSICIGTAGYVVAKQIGITSFI